MLLLLLLPHLFRIFNYSRPYSSENSCDLISVPLFTSHYVWDTHIYSIISILNFRHVLNFVAPFIFNSVLLCHWVKTLFIFRFSEHHELVSEDTLFLLLNIFSWIATCALFWVCTLQSRCQISITKNCQQISSSGFVKNPTCLHIFVEIYVASYPSADKFRMVGRFLRKPASF